MKMKKYKERGGWFWFLIATLTMMVSIYHQFIGDISPVEHINYSLLICASVIMHKVERISNALHDKDH